MNKRYYTMWGCISFVLGALIAVSCQPAWANISGAHGLAYSQGNLICKGGTYSVDPDSRLKAGACTLNFHLNVYVPHTGMYRVRTFTSASLEDTATSTPASIDATLPIAVQNIVVSGTDKSIQATKPGIVVHFCYTLMDEDGIEYSWEGSGSGCTGYQPEPLPPTPPQPPTSCTINNATSLDVNLGTFERDDLATVPGTGTVKQVQIPVSCSGASSITLSMALNYTPITVSGQQVAQTSSKGIGVAIIYGGKPLSSTDSTSLTFSSGSSSFTLGFEPVRNPSIEKGEIPTGDFTASAVLVMTQQ